ncbi:MAG: response regulator [Syntrophorhabdaceae bacterium]|nr:response regulator [Syntrophorhabdaceae bacterium]
MSGARILVVEDEAIEALDIERRLTASGYTVIDSVSTGEEAVRRVEETGPDLVLMDISLHGEMDGVSAAGMIRTQFDIPVVYLTAYADEPTLQRAKLTEPHGYIVKPFKERELYIAIDMALYKHKLERKLKENEKWLATTLRSIGDAVIATDNAGQITFMNGVAEDLLGWKLEEVLNRKLTEVFTIVNRDTRLPVENPVTRVLREGFVVGLANHTVLIARNGSEIPIDDSAAPIKDDNRAITGVILVFRDVTERQEAEENVLREKTFSEMAINSLPGIFYLFEQNGTIRRWNSNFEQVTGYSPDEITRMTLMDFFSPEEQGSIAQAVNEVFSDGKAIFEENLLCKDGRTVPHHFMGFRMIVDGVPYLVGSGTDVTGHRAMENELRRARDELERRVEERTFELWEAYEALRAETEERARAEAQLRQSQKMEAIGTLAGGIAHDFNNILAGIIGFTEMVLEDVPPESPIRRNLEYILKGGLRGRDLVKQILAFTRQNEQERRPVALGQLIGETLKLIRPVVPSTIDIRKNIDSVEDTVMADPVQIEQVIMNLCTNAAHAMRDTGGLLEVGLADGHFFRETPIPSSMKPGTYVRLSVSDTGNGMEPDILERVFDPFFTTKGPGEGTGLGLSVVHGIAKSHGGHVTAHSEPGRGSTFHVYLPKIESVVAGDAGGHAATLGGSECILLVDDEETIVEMNSQRLSSLGYKVVAIMNSVDALKAFEAEPGKFDLLITDYTMPHMTGMDLATAVLKIKPDFPVILSSGLDEEMVKEAGVKAFLSKTAGKRELASLIRRVLEE